MMKGGGGGGEGGAWGRRCGAAARRGGGRAACRGGRPLGRPRRHDLVGEPDRVGSPRLRARTEYIGHHVAEFHLDPPVIDEMLARLARGETLLNYDARLRHKDGTTRFVHINSNVLWRDKPNSSTRVVSRAMSATGGPPRNSKVVLDRAIGFSSISTIRFDRCPMPKKSRLPPPRRSVSTGVNRCAYAAVEDDEDTFVLTGNYNNGVHSIVGRYRFRQFGEECLRLMRTGSPTSSPTRGDPRITEAERPSYAMTAIRAVVCVPILKQGRFVAAMAVHAVDATDLASRRGRAGAAGREPVLGVD